MQEMKQMLKQLKTIYWGIASGALAFACIVEFIMMDVAGGILADDNQIEFVFESIAILLTLASIYFSLRLFKFKKIKNALCYNPLENYRKYCVLRFAMLELPLLFNILCYWLFVNSSFAWLGVLIGLAFPFVYPTKERFLNETDYQL